MHKVSSEENVADVLTKHMPPGKFQLAAESLGIREYKDEDTADA